MYRTQETFTSKTPVRMCTYLHVPSSSWLQLSISLCLLHSPSPQLLHLCLTFQLYHILPSLYAQYGFSWKLIKFLPSIFFQIPPPAIFSFLFSFHTLLCLLFCLWAHKDYLSHTTIHSSWRAWERLSWILLRGCAVVCMSDSIGAP